MRVIVQRNNIKRLTLSVLVIVLAALIGRVQAQPEVDPPPVGVGFVQGCYVPLDFDTLQMHFIVMADGVDTYAVAQTNVLPFQTNIPAVITTHAGFYDLGWVKMHSVDTSQQWTLRFTQLSTGLTMELPYSTWQTAQCDTPEYIEPGDPLGVTETPIVIVPEPDGSECSHSAFDSGTGMPYCYVEQPGGVVPIPPPITY